MMPIWIKSASRKKILIFVATGLVVFFAFLIFPGEKDGEEKTYHAVQRGDLTISVVEGGTLKAVEETLIRNELEGTNRIIYLVPEGTYVRAGELLVEFDAKQAEEALLGEQQKFEARKAALITAKNDLAITESTIGSDLRKADLQVEFAQMDLTKFIELEKGHLVRDAEIAIDTQAEELNLAQEKFEFSEKLAERNFETKSQVDRDKLDLSRAQKKLEVARGQQEMLEEFDLTKKYVERQSALTEAKAELERVKKQGDSKLAQKLADVSSAESTLELTEKSLAKMKEQNKATKIYAEEEGLVTYASRTSYNQEPIEEGAEVRNRQRIIEMPNLSAMKAEVRVHESMVTQVKRGQKAFVTLDALPDQQFSGVISHVAILPEPASRRNPDLKVYRVEVLLDDRIDRVKPGVSARAEIIVDQLRQVLFVPLQAVTTFEDQQVCYLKGQNDPRPIKTGLFNTQFIEVQEGLEPGDEVLLNPPLARRELVAETEGDSEEEGGEEEASDRQPRDERPGRTPGAERSSEGSARGERSGGGGERSGRGRGGKNSGAGGRGEAE